MKKPDTEKVSLRMEAIWTNAENRIIQDIAKYITAGSRIRAWGIRK